MKIQIGERGWGLLCLEIGVGILGDSVCYVWG